MLLHVVNWVLYAEQEGTITGILCAHIIKNSVFAFDFPDQMAAAQKMIGPPQNLSASRGVCALASPSSVGDNSSIFSALFASPVA